MFIMACTYLVCDLWGGAGNESVCNGGCGKNVENHGARRTNIGFLKMIRFTAVRQSVNKRRLHTSRTYSQSEITNKASMFIHIIHKLLVHNETKSEAVMFPGEVTIAHRIQLRSKCTSAKPIVHLIYTNVQWRTRRGGGRPPA